MWKRQILAEEQARQQMLMQAQAQQQPMEIPTVRVAVFIEDEDVLPLTVEIQNVDEVIAKLNNAIDTQTSVVVGDTTINGRYIKKFIVE